MISKTANSYLIKNILRDLNLIDMRIQLLNSSNKELASTKLNELRIIIDAIKNEDDAND